MSILTLLVCFFALFAFIISGLIWLIMALCHKSTNTPRRISLWALASSVVIFLVYLFSSSSLNEIITVIALLLLLAGAILLCISLIGKLLCKNVHKLFLSGILSLLVGFILLLIGASPSISTSLFLAGILLILCGMVLLPINIVRQLLKKQRWRNWIIMAACVIVGVLMVPLSNAVWQSTIYSNPEKLEKEIQIDYDFVVEDADEKLELITSRGFDTTDSLIPPRYRHVFDCEDTGLLLANTYATAYECIQTIEASNTIPEKFKSYFVDFVDRIDALYPQADLSILYHNLQTLQVVELSQTDYLLKSWSMDSYGCYVMPENAIYIPQGTEYTEGEWGFQVLIHEFCHAARTSWFDEEKTSNRITFGSLTDTTLLEESMNSAFSCSLLNYYEWDIAYQVPSNYLRIMLECMDNYQLSDYLNHSDAYFLTKLDETAGDTNYAYTIWKLITLQRRDWESNSIDIPDAEYEPIYEYLCRLYYGKYTTDTMTDAELEAVADELVKKAFFDAPEGYKTDAQYFYDYLGLKT